MLEGMIRSWKRVFDKDGFDPENPSYPEREDLTEKQKDWVKRAWTIE